MFRGGIHISSPRAGFGISDKLVLRLVQGLAPKKVEVRRTARARFRGRPTFRVRVRVRVWNEIVFLLVEVIDLQ